MSFRCSKVTAMAVGVAAAEGASYLHYMFVPWFLGAPDRSLYASIGFNILLFGLINGLVEKFWYLRTWKDAIKLSVWLTLVYVTIYGPYVIYWWNPVSYLNLIGPAGHTLVQVSAMTCTMWYFKDKKW